MAEATYTITDGDEFIGIVWETKLGKIITLNGKINPQMGFSVQDCKTGEEVIGSDMVDVLAEILPWDF